MVHRAEHGRRLRLRPQPWAMVARERLRAAWEQVRSAAHDRVEDLDLVGIYGPLPVDAVEAVTVAGVGRTVAVSVASAGRSSRPGDLVVARPRTGGEPLCVLVVHPGPVPPAGATVSPPGPGRIATGAG